MPYFLLPFLPFIYYYTFLFITAQHKLSTGGAVIPFPSPTDSSIQFGRHGGGGSSSSRMRRICIPKIVFLLLLCARMLPAGVSAAKIHGNPANDLVALINGKRAASKLPALRNSRGLGCMALQYISECMAATGAACSSGNTVACQPPEAHITEVYAANCGVELPTVDVISGRLVGCHRERDGPEDALRAVLASATGNGTNATAAMSVIRGKEHTQVGAGFDRAHRRGPFFWCLLFSSGSANSTFLLEAGGKGIDQTHGCFSAPDRPSCNAAAAPTRPGHLNLMFTIGAAAALLFRRLVSCW